MRTVTALVMALAAGGAQAQDLLVYGGAELEFYREEFGPGTGNSSYLSGYVEAETNGFFGGLWAEIADDDIYNEVNVYLGYRGETAAGLSYSAGYIRYIYPNDGGDCCGEVFVGLGLPLGETVSTTLDLAYDPENDLGNAYVGFTLAATEAIEVSANYGVYELEAAGSEREWDLGASYALGESSAIDLRYFDGSEYVDSYFGLSLTWDTTLLGG
jgi:hypothetical protein